MPSRSRRIGSVLGLLIGDAVGTTNEFRQPGTFPRLTDMVGGGTFALPAGAWTDDGAMAMCLAESLIECGGFNAEDQMQRYVHWWREGYWGATGTCIDIGITTRRALLRFEANGDPIAGDSSAESAGNGSIMRLAPVVAFYASDPAAAVRHARASSRTTHAAAECIDGCELLARLLLLGYSGESMTGPIAPGAEWSAALVEVARTIVAIDDVPPRPPSGYVVDTLACARWCLARSSSFREAVLCAANLGGDADTIAAVTGQLAGARWGVEGIPPEWIDKLAMHERVMQVVEKLADGPR